MNNKKPVLVTIEILEGKSLMFLESLASIEKLRSKGKPVKAEILNNFFDCFISKAKSDDKKINSEVNRLLNDFFSKMDKNHYDFDIKQLESMGFAEVLANGQEEEVMHVVNYSLTDLIIKIYTGLLNPRKAEETKEIGEFIRCVNGVCLDYFSKIKVKKPILSKWKVGLLVSYIAAQFGYLHFQDQYDELRSSVKYEDYLYDKYRYYTERTKKTF